MENDEDDVVADIIIEDTIANNSIPYHIPSQFLATGGISADDAAIAEKITASLRADVVPPRLNNLVHQPSSSSNEVRITRSMSRRNMQPSPLSTPSQSPPTPSQSPPTLQDEPLDPSVVEGNGQNIADVQNGENFFLLEALEGMN